MLQLKQEPARTAGRRVDFLEVGKSRFLGPENPEIWDLEIQKVGVQKMKKKTKFLKIQIRSAQNVGKVWISRKKILPALFGAIPGHFFHGPEKCKKKKCKTVAYVPLVGPCCYPPLAR